MSCAIISQELVITEDVIFAIPPSGGGGADATAVLNNTLGTELSSTPIASGATSIIVAPDATIIINDNAGAEAVNTQVASGVTETFNITIT
tara:strand:+ start:520 stop:792 length:273 start_codon:yes stop_codon:yes gene_type:complete